MEVTYEENKPNKEVKENESCSTKIKGGGLLKMLEQVLPMLFGANNDKIEEMNPFDFVDDKDLDDNDEVVKKFKDEDNGLGGIHGVIKIIKIKKPEDVDKFAQVFSEMYEIRKAEKLSNLRLAFAAINKARSNTNVAKSQVEALEKIENLMADADNSEEFRKFSAIKTQILKGNSTTLDAAAYRVREVFASYVPKANIRLAYTSIVTQDGEPFQLCPKARYQIGVAKPIEISKCRDNCIDSRTTTEGKTICAYAEWLKVADNQNAVNDRLEVHRNPDNEANSLNLKPGQRTKKATFNEKTYEERIQDSNKNRTEIPEKSLEARLDDATAVELGHHGDTEESIPEVFESKESIPTPQKRQAKVDKIESDKEDTMGEQISEVHDEIGDETIEEMLNDEWGGLSEEELDETLEMLLRQIDKDK